MNRLISVFPNTDLRSGHAGLAKVARKFKEDPRDLSPGELILFINRSQTAFKIYASGNVIVHYKHDRGMINLQTIQYLPSCLSGNQLDYSKALGEVLKRTLKVKDHGAK